MHEVSSSRGTTEDPSKWTVTTPPRKVLKSPRPGFLSEPLPRCSWETNHTPGEPWQPETSQGRCVIMSSEVSLRQADWAPQ